MQGDTWQRVDKRYAKYFEASLLIDAPEAKGVTLLLSNTRTPHISAVLQQGSQKVPQQ